jgi:hypothetical protein
LGAALDQAGQSTEARANYERAREVVATKLGLAHPTAQSHLRRIQFNDGIALMDDQPERAQQMLAPLMAAPELPIRVKAISAWLVIAFDGTTRPEQLVHTHELLQALREGPNLEPQVRAEGLTIAGHLLVGAGDAAGFELMREALAVWNEHFPSDPSTVQAAVRFAQALHDAGRDDEAREACRAVRRLQVTPPEQLAVELAALERELGI